MSNKYIKENSVVVSIIMFVVIFCFIQKLKPVCFFNMDGSIREFGVGYKNKTIFPVWLMSIFLGLTCYLGVMYYVSYSKHIIF